MEIRGKVMPTIYKNKIQYSGSSIGGVETVAGIIQMYGGSTAPDGYLLCDGSEVSRSTYQSLFAAIGTTYGDGDGSTTFNLPDLRGRVAVGAGTGTAADATAHTLGSDGGEEKHKLTITEMPAHGHKLYYQQDAASGTAKNRVTPNGTAGTAGTSNATQNTGDDGAHNNMQPYLTINYIVSTGRMDSGFSNLMYSEQHGYSGGIQDKYLLTPDTVAELEDAGLVTESGSSGKIDQAIGSMTGTVLFDNDQNNSETIQLLDSASNYDRMEIYYKSNDNGWDHASVIHPDGKDISLISNTPRSNADYFKAVIYHINGNSISVSSNYYAQLSFTSTSHTFQNSVNIYITQVLGYKYA